MNKQEFEKQDKENKEKFFGNIGISIEDANKLIMLMTKNANRLGQTNVNIPNFCITLNNKLVELSHVFESAGVSMFTREFEEQGFYGTSFLGDAIIKDFLERAKEAGDRLADYSKIKKDIASRKNKEIIAYKNKGPIEKFFLKLKTLFTNKGPIDLSLTEEEKMALDSSLYKYQELNDETWNYRLDKDLVGTLVRYIAGPEKIGNYNIPHRYTPFSVPGLVKTCVVPELEELGLEGLLPELQEKLIKEYEKDLPVEDFKRKAVERDFLVPDFEKEKGEVDPELMEQLRQKEGWDYRRKEFVLREERKKGGLEESEDLATSTPEGNDANTSTHVDFNKRDEDGER